MTQKLDLTDIQGNIVRAYGRFGFPHGRFFLLNIADAAAGRALLAALEPRVTTAERWEGGPDNLQQKGIPLPPVTLNVGLTYKGLLALDLPGSTLSALPSEFSDGMVKRAEILGDTGPSALKHWDPVWRNGAENPKDAIHILVSMNARMHADGKPFVELEEQSDWLRGLVKASKKAVRILTGHGVGNEDFQQAGALLVDNGDGTKRASPKEHFGFDDGIGDPVFAGQFSPEAETRRVKGRGKLTAEGTWEPLAAGEFVMGHVDEFQELPMHALPFSFVKNGSFMAFRKLHENVGSFETFLTDQVAAFAGTMDLSEEAADATLRAKMVGRWANGVPLMAAPTYEDLARFEQEWSDIPALRAKSGRRTEAENKRVQAFKEILIDFKYKDDRIGLKCPIGAHIRRGNIRDYLDPKFYIHMPDAWDGSAISNRRRILRRGLPYGSFDPDKAADKQEHGVLFLAVCTSIQRQFEFVLQQWINYGMDLNSGNDTCPVLGPRPPNSKFVVQSDPDSGNAPFIMANIPQFVTTRGGEYFFIPGLNALRMIASGTIDPT